MDISNLSKNCASEVWYMLHTRDMLQMRKYNTEPRVATGLNSSRAMLIFCSVSFAVSNFSLTQKSRGHNVIFNCVTNNDALFFVIDYFGSANPVLTFRSSSRFFLFQHYTSLRGYQSFVTLDNYPICIPLLKNTIANNLKRSIILLALTSVAVLFVIFNT